MCSWDAVSFTRFWHLCVCVWRAIDSEENAYQGCTNLRLTASFPRFLRFTIYEMGTRECSPNAYECKDAGTEKNRVKRDKC